MSGAYITVLIADDSAAIRRAVRALMEQSSLCQVCGEAEDGKSAVELVHQLHPDVVVLDLSMPVMNGIEAAREISASEPHTKVVLFTAYDSEPLKREAQRAGVSTVLSKHSNRVLERLLRAIQEASKARAA
jgi:DNA-binding NarL/FixJ family response regulator